MTQHDPYRGARPTDDRLALGNGHDLAECITPGGERALWLIVDDDQGDTPPARIPAHERLGALPWQTRAAINAAFNPDRAARCLATARTTGIRCRNVPVPGSEFCRAHAGQAVAR